MKLFSTEGRPTFGLFKEPVTDINYEDYDYRSLFHRPKSLWSKHFALRTFQFIGLTSSQWMMSCVIVKMPWTGYAYLHVYDKNTQTAQDFCFKQPFGYQTHFDASPMGLAHLKKGQNHFQINCHDNKRHLQVSLANGLRLDALLQEPKEPLVLCSPVGFNGWAYTQKAPGLMVEGHFTYNKHNDDLAACKTLGSYDWTMGFLDRNTTWNWASLAATLESGEIIGLNLSAGVNETSFTENAFWHQGKLHKVDTVYFDFDKHHWQKPWRITSQDGKVQLDYTPTHTRIEQFNYGILATNFKQIVGKFSGELRTPEKIITLNNVDGWVEDHFIRW